MPVLQELDIQAANLQRGDTITADSLPKGRGAVTVTTTLRKQVNTWVNYENANGQAFTLQVRNDRPLHVLREVPTDEENTAKERAYTVRFLRIQLSKFDVDPADALLDKVNRSKAGNWSERLDYGDVSAFVKQQAMWKLARDIKHVVQLQRDKIVEAAQHDHDSIQELDDHALFDGFAAWLAHITYERRRYPQDPTSRSTSIVSNLFEDADRWAQEKMLDDIQFYGIEVRAREIYDEWQAAKRRKDHDPLA